MGDVLGIDLGVALSFASSLGYDAVTLAELLPHGEAGLVTAILKAKDQSGVDEGS
jgi:hypothetical protein